VKVRSIIAKEEACVPLKLGLVLQKMASFQVTIFIACQCFFCQPLHTLHFFTASTGHETSSFGILNAVTQQVQVASFQFFLCAFSMQDWSLNASMKSQVSVSVLATSLWQYQVSLSGHFAFLCNTVHVLKLSAEIGSEFSGLFCWLFYPFWRWNPRIKGTSTLKNEVLKVPCILLSLPASCQLSPVVEYIPHTRYQGFTANSFGQV